MPFRSIDTGTGQPSGPMVWPACEYGHLSSQSFMTSPSLYMSAQLGAAGAGAIGAVGSGPSGTIMQTAAMMSPKESSLGAAKLERSEDHTFSLQSPMRISSTVY